MAKFAKTFDPATHSGNLHASLTEAARGLSVGQSTGLTDGSSIKAVKAKGRSSRWFMAHGHGQTDVSTHPRANDAASKVLDYSANCTHPASIGGTKSYPGYGAYKEATA